jgi:hypothetical protein
MINQRIAFLVARSRYIEGISFHKETKMSEIQLLQAFGVRKFVVHGLKSRHYFKIVGIQGIAANAISVTGTANFILATLITVREKSICVPPDIYQDRLFRCNE